MKLFRINCRATNIEHQCEYKNIAEPPHTPQLSHFIEKIREETENIEFLGVILSPKNNYQINMDAFDKEWILKVLNSTNMRVETPRIDKTIEAELPDIKPDSFLKNERMSVIVEIEKANKKTIWFTL